MLFRPHPAGGVDAEVVDRVEETLRVVLELADCRITKIAEQAADLAGRVIVIDIEILQEKIVVRWLSYRWKIAPVSSAICAAVALLLEQFLQRFRRHAVLSP
jgi:hypothetical protein